MVVSNIFYFHPYWGKIPILTNIFQMRWNHQLVMFDKGVFRKACVFFWMFFGRLAMCESRTIIRFAIWMQVLISTSAGGKSFGS